MAKKLSILILGGYGTFGGRTAQLLANEESLTLFIAGRSLEKAQAFCRQLDANAELIPHLFDRNGNIEAQLSEVKPDILLDATGPFQNYGNEPYRVIKACIASGVHYLDLADGSDFVNSVHQFDEAAKAQRLFVLSGVSSFPVLTAAVVQELSKEMKAVQHIRGGIAPSPYAGVGENVIRAIAGYSGQPVKLTRNGSHTHGYGFAESMRYTISPPGKLPLHNIRFSLVDVPDLQIIPSHYPELDSIWMGAGPVPEILHRMLNALAWVVRLKLLPSLLPFATVFYHAINILRWGEHRGGMFVEVSGLSKQNTPVTHSWHLLAEGNDGPLIPSMAIEAVVQHIMQGQYPASGARAATGDITLADYEKLFSHRTIYTGTRHALSEDTTLYKRMLHDVWDTLSSPIRDMHSLTNTKTVTGKADVERGKNLLANIIANLFGFPKAGKNVPVRVDFTVKNNKQYWRRTFDRNSFLSIQSEGKGRYQHLICERFGIFNFGLAAVVENEMLTLIIRRWDCLHIPLPLCLAPKGLSYEHSHDGKFHFHVEVILPVVGQVVRYKGYLEHEKMARCG
jgi:hypothetical protein